MKALSLLLLGAALAFGVVTVAALEGREVVVLHTTEPDGTSRTTRIWIADHEGSTYIEAANEQRDFYQNVLHHPDVELTRGAETNRYRATVLPNPEGHVLIRSLLRRRYGWADRWIGLIADTSNSRAVRLDPLRDEY